MKKNNAPISAVRSRTSRAILSAAASVLARDRTATLAQISDAAGVGYSTLNRYFPDRASLIEATVADSWESIGRAVHETGLDQGPPNEAMHRLVTALLEVGDRLLFLYGDSDALSDTSPDTTTDLIRDVIERGQAQGVFDPEVSAEWLLSVLWALVYSGCDAARRGVLPRQGIAPTVIHTLEKGMLRK